MRIIIKNNKIKYVYTKNKFSEGIVYSIIFYLIAILLFIVSIIISIINHGNAGSIVSGIVFSSFLFNFLSIYFTLIELYLYDNKKKYVRNMFFLEVFYFIFWAFII